MGFNIDEFDASPAEVAVATGKPALIQPASPESVSAAETVAQMLRGGPQGEAKTVEEALQVADDEYMSEVEERLEVAAHYRLLLQDSFFTDPTTKVARRVTYELRAWVRERLAELVGMSTPKKNALSDAETELLKALAEFTPTHLQALKLVADKVISGGGIKPAPSTAPTMAPKTAPKASGPALVKRGPSAGSEASQSQQEGAEPRGRGRPPGSKNKPKVEEPEMVQAIRRHPDGSEEPLFKQDKDGNTVPQMIRRVKKQPRAEGGIPFPDSDQRMAAATHYMAEAQASRGRDQHGQQIGGLVELAKTLPSNQ
jgi:hypothetical protein